VVAFRSNRLRVAEHSFPQLVIESAIERLAIAQNILAGISSCRSMLDRAG
jgi:hypothetical protein